MLSTTITRTRHQALTDDQLTDLVRAAERNDRRGDSGSATHSDILAITGSAALSTSQKIQGCTELGAQLRRAGDISYLQTHRAVRMMNLNLRVNRIR